MDIWLKPQQLDTKVSLVQVIPRRRLPIFWRGSSQEVHLITRSALSQPWRHRHYSKTVHRQILALIGLHPNNSHTKLHTHQPTDHAGIKLDLSLRTRLESTLLLHHDDICSFPPRDPWSCHQCSKRRVHNWCAEAEYALRSRGLEEVSFWRLDVDQWRHDFARCMTRPNSPTLNANTADVQL